MADGSSGNPIIRLVKQAARWRARSNRQIWLITLALVIATCAEAVVIPAKRSALLCGAITLAIMGWLSTASRRSRREREALVARLASSPRDEIPADVIDLVLTGKKMQAIKRYRQLTGISLHEAKALLDGL